MFRHSKENWEPFYVVAITMISILLLFADPSPNHHVFPKAASLYKGDRITYDVSARKWTFFYATGEIIYPNTRQDGFYKFWKVAIRIGIS
jgi:ubiquitin-protein ligase